MIKKIKGKVFFGHDDYMFETSKGKQYGITEPIETLLEPIVPNMRFVLTVVRPLHKGGKKCAFCGKEKNPGSKQLWGSDIVVVYLHEEIGKVTVCPDCREKYTITDMYAKLLNEKQGECK